MKKKTVWLIASICLLAIAIQATAEEKWQIKLKKDFAKVLREKKNPTKKHREFIQKSKEKGHLEYLLTLYEAEKPNRRNDAPFYYAIGYTYALHAANSAENLNIAVTYFQSAIEMDPVLFWPHFTLGAIYQQRNQNELALAEFRTCIEINPNHYPVYYQIGKIQLNQQDYAEALRSFETANNLNRKWEYPRYGIGLVHFAKGELNLARETFERLIQQKKKFAPPYFKLGQVFAMEGFFDSALEAYAKGAKYHLYTVQDVYELAVIFDEGGNSEGATQLYQRTLELEDSRGDSAVNWKAKAHFALAEKRYAEGNTSTAIQHYQKAIAGMPNFRNLLFEPLTGYFDGAMPADEARVTLEKAMNVLPDEPRSYFYAGILEANEGNVELAISHYQKTVEIVEAEPSYLQMKLLGTSRPEETALNFNLAYFRLGELYHQNGDIEAASTYFKRAIAINPELADMFIEQGRTAFDDENYQNAIEPLNTHLLLFPDDIDALYLLAQSYQAAGDTERALLFYQRTLALNPTRPDVFFKMVYIYRKQGEHQHAVDALLKIVEIEPENANAHYLSAQSYLELKQPDEALAAFMKTVELTPEHVDAQYQAGLLFEQNGDIDNTIIQYENTIALDANNAEPFFRLGAIYQKRNDEDNIIRVYQPALVLEPNHPNLHYLLAGILEKRDEREAAIHHYGLANHYFPDDFTWHYTYARLLDRHAETLGDDYHTHAEMAIAEYTATIGLNSAYVDAYFNRGQLVLRYKRIGKKLYRYSQILEDFKQVTELQPRNAQAHYYVGTINLEMDNHRQAATAFQKVLSLTPKYRGVNLHLGEIAEWEQAWKKAIQHYQAEVALVKPGENDEIVVKTYQNLGELYYAYGLDYNAAKENLEKALALDDTHVPTLINYANTLYSMDLLGAAAEQFRRVLQLAPEDLTANYNLALVYGYTEKTEQARAQWKRFLALNPPQQWKIEAEEHLRQLGLE